jgi:hypothetical protein
MYANMDISKSIMMIKAKASRSLLAIAQRSLKMRMRYPSRRMERTRERIIKYIFLEFS